MRGVLLVLLLAVPGIASAAPARTASGVAAGPHKEGEYGGVSPGESPSSHDPARPARPRRPPAKGTLTWIGFEAKDGGAEVFFQSVAPFTFSQRVEGATLVVHLSLPRLGHNTWRQVDTRFFDNPLSGIVAKAVGAARATKDRPARTAGIEARIAFKNAKDAHEGSVRTATEADGMYYVYLAFGEGAEPAEKPAAGSGSPTIDQPEVDEPATARPGKPARPAAQEPDTDAPPDMPAKKK
jgi:hypothetical protein